MCFHQIKIYIGVYLVNLSKEAGKNIGSSGEELDFT